MDRPAAPLTERNDGTTRPVRGETARWLDMEEERADSLKLFTLQAGSWQTYLESRS